MKSTDDLPMPRHPSYLTPEAFDELGADGQVAAIGRKVDTYSGGVGTVVRCRDGMVRVRVRLRCAGCRRRWLYAYLTTGAPGLCYAYDTDGNYLADLRNQEYRCCRGCGL